MSNQNSLFKKPVVKILSLLFAFSALAGSIIFSQSNAQTTKETKKDSPKIYDSSKSGIPHFPKKEPPVVQTDPNSKKEQNDNNQKESSKLEQPEQKNSKAESKVNDKKKKSPIMPSSKSLIP